MNVSMTFVIVIVVIMSVWLSFFDSLSKIL